MTSVERLFSKHHLYHLYQPIYHLSGRKVIGYEALLRGESGENPHELFRQAHARNQLFELDTLSLSAAISSYFHSGDRDELLFVNVFPSTLAADAFPSFVESICQKTGRFARRIVFEINETVEDGKIWKDDIIPQRIAALRQLGFLTAMDDVGEGYTTLKNVTLISPDYIKLDKFFSENLSKCEKKQKIVRLFAEFCEKDIGLILEGIEREEDLEKAVELGVELGQGYFLGKPAVLQERPGHYALSHKK